MLGALLADGWYCGFVGFDAKQAGAHYGGSPEFLAQLVISFDDGTDQRIVTDGGGGHPSARSGTPTSSWASAMTSPSSRPGGTVPASMTAAGARFGSATATARRLSLIRGRLSG